MLLTTLLGRPSPQNPERYNATVARQVDDFRDFIRLHYVSERRDTPFWRDVGASHPEHRRRAPRPLVAQDPGRRGLPARSRWACPTSATTCTCRSSTASGCSARAVAKAELAARPKVRAHARKTAAELIREYRIAAGRAEGHRPSWTP